MCGLVGVFGDPSVTMLKVFKHLLIIDQLRGTDSTGAFYVKENYKWGIIKDVGTPDGIISSNVWRDNLWRGTSDGDNIVLMGHNRAKTSGAIESENAHPFKHGNIVLAHNGTLWDQSKLQLKKERFDVDSEHICYHLNKKGIDETWQNIRGAAALTFYDMRGRDLNFIRNDHRPLFYCWNENGKNIFWASESWMLRAILDRNKVKIREDKVYNINPHFLHTFKWSPKTKTVTHSHRKLEEPKYTAPVNRGFVYVGPGNQRRSTNWNWNGDQDYDYAFGYGDDGRPAYTEGTRSVDNTGRSIPPGPSSNITHLNDVRAKVAEQEREREERTDIEEIFRRYKPKTADEFRELHLLCMLCNTPLSSDFRDSVLLDPSTGVCPSCFHDAESLVLTTVTVH